MSWRYLVAWIAMCGACSPLAIFWWPVGLIPVVVLPLLVLAFVRRHYAPPR
jgi:hypothetical protein